MKRDSELASLLAVAAGMGLGDLSAESYRSYGSPKPRPKPKSRTASKKRKMRMINTSRKRNRR